MPPAAETAYARMQRKIKLDQNRLARLMAQLANQKKKIAATTQRAGTFVRNKYISDPFVIRLLATHGRLNPRNIARLAIATGKHHVLPVMSVARNLKTQNNANLINIKRQYNTWYNSMTPNQKKQRAQNYNRELNGAAWYNLNIIRNMNVTNTRLPRVPLWFAAHSSAPYVRNMKNAIWKRNGIRADWEPGLKGYNSYRAFRNLKRTRGKTYNINNYKN